MASNVLEQLHHVAGGLEQHLSSESEGFKMVSARRYLRKSHERRLAGPKAVELKSVEPLRLRALSSSSDSDSDDSNSSDSDNEGGSGGKTKAPTPTLTFPPHLFEGTLAPSAAPTIFGERLSSTAQSSNLTAATVGGSFAAGFFLIFLAVGILFVRRRKTQTAQNAGGLTGASAIPVGGGAVGARVKALSDHSDITLYDDK